MICIERLPPKFPLAELEGELSRECLLFSWPGRRLGGLYIS